MLLLKKDLLVDRDGFKYIKYDRVFEEGIYKELNKGFPELNKLIKKGGYKELKFSNGNRFDIDKKYITKYDILTDKWFQLIEEVTSLEFFKELCDIFEVDEDKYKSISYRNETDKTTDVKVDFQICYNMKNKNKKGYLRKPHIDAKDKIFVLLLYFPYLEKEYKDEDEGQLCLYDREMEEIDDVKYIGNRGIIFLNNECAIHAPRMLRNHEDEHRRFINVVFMENK